MGVVSISMHGTFPTRQFSTCAEEGGHVMALKRSIEFLAAQLGEAVVNDAELTGKEIIPPTAPLGKDRV